MSPLAALALFWVLLSLLLCAVGLIVVVSYAVWMTGGF